MYSFPATMPVAGDNANYVPAVYAITFAIITLYWFLRAKGEYSVHSGDQVE